MTINIIKKIYLAMIITIILMYFVLMKFYKIDKNALFTLIVMMTILYTTLLVAKTILSNDFDPQLALLLLVI